MLPCGLSPLNTCYALLLVFMHAVQVVCLMLSIKFKATHSCTYAVLILYVLVVVMQSSFDKHPIRDVPACGSRRDNASLLSPPSPQRLFSFAALPHDVRKYSRIIKNVQRTALGYTSIDFRLVKVTSAAARSVCCCTFSGATSHE